MPRRTPLLIAAAALLLPPGLAAAQTDNASGQARPDARRAEFGRQLSQFITRLRASPTAPPGTAVVVVHRGETVFEQAYGTRDNRSGAPLTLDTPMYNGSVTKAYTGVLAAILDADGTLPLSASLQDVWADLRLPEPLDARAVTAEHLLSHSAALAANGLVFRSVWTGNISARDVPPHLARFARPRRPGFQYQNLGPFIWSAMAEARTGTPWRTLLQDRVLRPLGLRRSTARLEDFGSDGVARCHPRVGGGWRSDPPKPTATLNAAGGMYTSPRDAAAFLKAMITDGRSAGGAIPAAALRRSWQRASEQDRSMWGLHRDGYGLGWDLGTISGRRFVSRSGGYPGCRAMSMFLPDEEFGIVVMSNGGVGANSYHAAIFGQAIDFWTGAADADARAAERIETTQREVAAAIRDADAGDPRLVQAPPFDPSVWQEATGTYGNERLVADVRIVAGPEGLRLTAGVLSAPLHLVSGDSFLLYYDAEDAPETFDFVRDGSGRIIAFMWDDDRYDRVS